MPIRTLLYILPLFFIGSTFLSAQQYSVGGKVAVQNSKYKTGKVQYLDGVYVQAAFAKSALTDQKGEFKLTFVGLNKGEKTQLKVKKNGYEVVNEKALQDVIVGRASHLDIYMCVEGELIDNQLVYYNIAKEAITKSYQRKIAKLQASYDDAEELIASLEDQLNKTIASSSEALDLLNTEKEAALETAREIAGKFAYVNLDNVSDDYVKAFDAYQKGQLDKALKILDPQLLKNKLEKAVAERNRVAKLKAQYEVELEKAQKNIAENIEAWILRARVANLNNKRDEARAAFETAIEYDADNLELLKEYAEFCDQNYMYKRGIDVINLALPLEKDESRQIELWLWQATLMYHADMSDDLQKVLDKAAQKAEVLYKRDANAHFSQLLEVYSKYIQLNRLGAFNEKYFEKAEAIGKKHISRKSKPEHQIQLGLIYFYWGDAVSIFDFKDITSSTFHPKVGAEKALNKAVEWLERAEQKAPDAIYHLVRVTNSLGELYTKQGNCAEALKSFQKAEQYIIKALAPYYDKNGNANFSGDDPVNTIGLFFRRFDIAREQLECMAATQGIPATKVKLGKIVGDIKSLAKADSILYYKQVAKTLEAYANLTLDYEAYLDDGIEKFESMCAAYERLNDLTDDAFLTDYLDGIDIGVQLFIQQYAKNRDFDYRLKAINYLDFAYDEQLFNYEEGSFVAQLCLVQLELSYEELFLKDSIFIQNLLKKPEDLYDYNWSNKEFAYIAICNIVHRGYYNSFFKGARYPPIYFNLFNQGINLFFELTEEEPDEYEYGIMLAEYFIQGIEESVEHVFDSPGVQLWLGQLYGLQSYRHLFLKQYAESEQTAKEGIDIAPDEIWIKTNQGHALLFQGKFEQAKAIYLANKEVKLSDGKTFGKAVLDDFNDLEKAGITHPDMAKIRKLLK